jgi:dTDP-4-dehydrorhamnose reductase
MKALIFGGRGMLAQDLERELLQKGHSPIALDRFQADVTQVESVRNAVLSVHPDLVFNCAAYTKVDAAETEPEAAFRVNGVGARNVAAVTAAFALPMVHLSTDYVFDGTKVEGYGEWDPLKPLSVYGESKALGEFQVRSLNPHHLIIRTQWLYGFDGPNFVQTMLRLGRERSRVQVVDDQVGSPTYTRDLAAALITLVEDHAIGTYHLTNSGTCSWRQFAEHIFQTAGLPIAVDPIDSAQLARSARRPMYGVLHNRMWVAEGRVPLRSYVEALADYLCELEGGRR